MDLKAMRIAIENCIVCLRIRIVNSMEWNDCTYRLGYAKYNVIKSRLCRNNVLVVFEIFSLICSGCEKWFSIWFVTTITVFFPENYLLYV